MSVENCETVQELMEYFLNSTPEEFVSEVFHQLKFLEEKILEARGI